MTSPYPKYEVMVSEAITQCLKREGVRRVFGIPSSYMMVQLDTFHRAGIKGVESRHEGAAAFMAAGYTMASGNLGVVYTAAGPGTTNALTGVAAAYMDSIPMLLMMSQCPRPQYGLEGHQESSGYTRGIDQMDIFRTCSYFNARPMLAATAIPMLRLALRQALGRRGPACYELPMDLQYEKVMFEDMPVHAYRSQSAPVDSHDVETICRLIRDSKHPAIIVGDALTHVDAADELVALCEEQQIACATVNYAKGVIREDHPLSLGICGDHGHQSAYQYLANADLVISAGVRLGFFHTDAFNRSLFKQLVQIDDDPQEIGRTLPVAYGAVGNVPAMIKAIRIAMKGSSHTREVSGRIADLRATHHVYDDPETRLDSAPLTPPRVLRAAREALPRDTLVIGDTGTTVGQLCRHFPVYSKDGFFALYAMASMGSGLPLSLGVQQGRPEATVLNVIGDGGFYVHEAELSVAAQHNLPVITLVLNNGRYKSVSDRQELFFERTFATDVPSSRFSDIARAHGCDGYVARTADEVHTALRKAVEAKRPAVIEVDIDRDYRANASGASRAQAAARKLFPTIPTGWPMPPVDE